MKKILLFACVSFALFALLGCGKGGVCDQTNLNYTLTTGIPIIGSGIAAGCLASDVNDTVTYASESSSKASLAKEDEAKRVKTFRATPEVESDLTNTPGVLDFVMAAQDKYRAGDYGSTTEAEKTSLIGRYASDGRVLVIRDQQKFWQVAYENEQTPLKKQ